MTHPQLFRRRQTGGQGRAIRGTHRSPWSSPAWPGSEPEPAAGCAQNRSSQGKIKRWRPSKRSSWSICSYLRPHL